MTLHVYFFFPETAGATLEETAAIFEAIDGPRWTQNKHWYVGTPAWKTSMHNHKGVRMEKGELSEERYRGRNSIEKRGSEGSSDAAMVENV